jgi:uncharacterized protein affecting Mg2+/Co2+ transport
MVVGQRPTSSQEDNHHLQSQTFLDQKKGQHEGNGDEMVQRKQEVK